MTEQIITVPIIGVAELRRDPVAAAATIEAHMALTAVTVPFHDHDLVVLEATFSPTLELEAHSYPIERARIAQFTDPRHPMPYAFPIGPPRTWEHSYPSSSSLGWLGQLCLWYPLDPPHLTWNWSKGLIDFVEITRRHLWFEERFRRTGVWPVEDAPHGQRADQRPHPIRTIDLQRAS